MITSLEVATEAVDVEVEVEAAVAKPGIAGTVAAFVDFGGFQ